MKPLEAGDSYVVPADAEESPHVGHTITVLGVKTYDSLGAYEQEDPTRVVHVECECGDSWFFDEVPT